MFNWGDRLYWLNVVFDCWLLVVWVLGARYWLVIEFRIYLGC